MVVPKEALDKARKLLEEAKRPIFLHDDDCDGTTSFVLCYQFCKEGKSVPVKRSPSVGPEFLKSVKEFDADLIVILDKPRVDPEFLQQAGRPVLWIDHHEPQKDTVKPFQHVYYFNPRLWDDQDNRPTSYWAYRITGMNLWLATIGSIADWHVPDYLPEFAAAYPDLVPEKYSKIEDLYLDCPIGTIIRVIQFNLKGQTAESKKSILTLTRIDSPYEILKQTTARGKFLWKKYEKLAGDYELALAAAKEKANDTPILAYIYEDDSMTFTSELSNELLIRFPDKITIVGRHHDGMYKCSVRSRALELPPILNTSLKGLDGTGGGHKFAVGTAVNEKDWDEFLARFTKSVEEKMK